MSDLCRVTIASKVVADGIDERLPFPDGMELSIRLSKIKKSKFAGMTKLASDKALTDAFVTASSPAEKFRAFGAMLKTAPKALAEKVILESTLESKKTKKPAKGLNGWVQRQWGAAALGWPAPDELCVMKMKIEQIHPDATIPEIMNTSQLGAFIVALVAFVPATPNAVLDHMGGVEGITRPTVAPAMSSGDKAIWIAKVSEIVLEAAATGKGAKRTFEFATPARFVAHLESGRTYDTTAWPVLGGT